MCVSCRRVGLFLVALLAVLLLPACTGSSGSSAQPEAERFAAALSRGDLTDVAFAAGSIHSPQRWWSRTREGMGASTLTVQVANVAEHGDESSASLRYRWDLAGSPTDWSYTTRLGLVRRGDDWAVVLHPDSVAPGLAQSDLLALSMLPAERADILGAGGVPLVTERPVVRFGIDKTRVPAAAQSASARSLASLLDIDAAAYAERVAAAGPDAFVEGLVLRAHDATAELKQASNEIPGARAIADSIPLAPTREFARGILGTVGPVTAEMVAASKGAYRVGDVAGLSGLEQRYDAQLRGTPGVLVQAVDANDRGRTLFQSAPRKGVALRTTLDLGIQHSAEQALADTPSASALVAIRPSSGDVLAAASGPGSAGYPTATVGQYAPGSTFKVVSSLALLRAGLSPDSVVHCPPTVTVDGKQFKNYSDYPAAELGDITLQEALANSCNTAFIGERDRITPDGLTDAAAALGLGVDHDLGFPAYFGSVPSDAETTTHAADLIGQGHILASPLAMASVAGSVAAGHTVVPHLLEQSRPAADPAAPLTAEETRLLQQLMASVVADGSGSFLADLPGPPILAKTGTAEFGTKAPLQTHAWMIAVQGDLAVAVFVDVGESGSQTAGPILEEFLRDVG